MVILGGWVFLMSEVPLYRSSPVPLPRPTLPSKRSRVHSGKARLNEKRVQE